ncbi:MAG: DUF2330 domain-containing protein [Pirellulales bacterium]
MHVRAWLTLPLAAVAAMVSHSPACCPAPPSGRAVVNADQTVAILWDAARQTQHFIRQASFKSEVDDFGFLVPSPSQPELEESGNAAFPFLAAITAPEVRLVSRPRQGLGCGCGSAPPLAAPTTKEAVRVLEEKQVAGFAAVVLESDSTTALVDWLRENGYAFSPEVEAWAKPYVEQNWKFTALKVAKDESQAENRQVAAAALRISFQTDRPLFPYREPDSSQSAETLGASSRLLRIYFLGEARYDGELTPARPWTGQAAWAGKLSDENRQKILQLLRLPEATGPTQWWLTEFEDHWPYEIAPADLYFAPSAQQDELQRPPVVHYVSTPVPGDLALFALAAMVVLPLVWRSRRLARTA